MTILQQQTIADSRADWSQTLSFDQFDPALGTLQSVATGVTVDTAGSVSVESLDAALSSITILRSGNIGVTGPHGAESRRDRRKRSSLR